VSNAVRQTPEPIMNRLGTLLAEHSALTLDRLDWARSDGVGRDSGRTVGRTNPNDPAAGPVVEVGGRVTRFDGDYREAIARFDQFVQTLRATGLGSVSVERAPFDLGPGSGVSGDSGTTASTPTDQTGEFVLQLRLTMDTAERVDG